MSFDPLDHPIALAHPERLTPHSGWTEHIPFGMALVDLLRPKVIVELGTQHGDSYCALCQAVRELRLETRCHAVDRWEGDEHCGFYGPEVLEELRTHHDARYGAFSQLIRCTFDEAAERFEERSIDLLHIDGYHTYEAVAHDLETWLPKMSVRGVVLLHDTSVRRDDFGVWRVFGEAKERYPNFELLHGHGLGLLAVGERPPKALQSLTRATEAQRQAIREHFHRLGERLSALARVDVLTQEAAAREHRVAALSHRASELQKIVADRDRAIEELSHRAGESEALRRALDEERTTFRSALDELGRRHESDAAAHEERARALEARHDEQLRSLAAEREARARTLEARLGQAAQEAAQLRARLGEAERRADDLEHELSSTSSAERTLRAELDRARLERAQVAKLEHRIAELEAQLEHVVESTGFRLVKLQREVMDRLLPVHSRRREPYVSASRLVGRLIGRGRPPMIEPPRPIPAPSPPADEPERPEPVAARPMQPSLRVSHPRFVRVDRRPLEVPISLVIPTKNGEEEGLNDCLRAIRQQRGVGEVEIVVVDSGSTDATLEIARDWGATIVEIPPEEFNHGGTRNFGFDLASGELVGFTVQDAILGAEDVLYELASMVHGDPRVAVASLRQVPRATADLFACWQLHSLREGLGIDTRVSSVDPLRLRHLPAGERWRLGYVDDVFAIHRRSVFDQLRYRPIEHAEDADYGQRVLETGRAVAFLGARAVIHSHDRSDHYHLKNYYRSRIVMGPMLGDVDPTRWEKTGVGSFAELIEGARGVFAGLNALAASIDADREHDLAAFRDALGLMLAEPVARVADAPAGSELAPVMEALGDVAGSAAVEPGRFRLMYEWNIDHLLWPYLTDRYRKLDGRDLVEVVYKLFGSTLGSDLANFVLAPPVETDSAALDRAVREVILR